MGGTIGGAFRRILQRYHAALVGDVLIRDHLTFPVAAKGVGEPYAIRKAIGTWTKIGLSKTDCNDKGAFDATNNCFVAPRDAIWLRGSIPACAPPIRSALNGL